MIQAIKKYKLCDINDNQMLNEKFTFCFKIAIKWNPIKFYGTRLKSAKYKTHVIKEELLK